MDKCGTTNPTHDTVSCYLSAGNHPVHTGLDGVIFRDWTNKDYQSPERPESQQIGSPNRKKLKDMAIKVRGSATK